jgi:hypothetical protein
MTMNEYGFDDEDRGVAMAADPVTMRAEQSELNRRRLLSGLAVGAAGLLLPGQVAAAPLNRGVRIEVANREWGSVPLSFWYVLAEHSDWRKSSETTLARGESKAFKSTTERLSDPQRALALIDGQYSVFGFNPIVGLPSATGYRGSNPNNAREQVSRKLKEGESLRWRVEGDKVIHITRRNDSAGFKEFLVELKKESRDMVLREADGGA